MQQQNTEHCILFIDLIDIPGPVVNIYSYVDNCTTVIITWDNPEDHRNELPVLYYNLSIIDEVNNNLFGTVSVYGTSYQFEDEDIFIHCYTYVITGVNELGEGISENKTFSYARGTCMYSMRYSMIARDVSDL